MARIAMLEAFETGHPAIDADHRRLAGVISEVGEAVANARPGQCLRLLDGFIVAAKDHFSLEEKLLREIGFPRLRQHAGYHGRLLRRAMEVREMCGNHEDPADVADCFDKLVELFIDDVVRGDIDFKSYIAESMPKTL